MIDNMKKVLLCTFTLFLRIQARMEILGGMMPQDDTYRQQNLDKAYKLGRNL